MRLQPTTVKRGGCMLCVWLRLKSHFFGYSTGCPVAPVHVIVATTDRHLRRLHLSCLFCVNECLGVAAAMVLLQALARRTAGVSPHAPSPAGVWAWQQGGEGWSYLTQR
jgi:hypothetical protein